jgi:transposase
MRIPIALTDVDRARLRTLMRQADVHPKTRERAEVVLLYAKGWTAEEVAEHVGRSERSVRRWLHAYAAGGLAALAPDRPGPVPLDRSALDERVRALLAEPRTWTIPQLREALRASGQTVSRRQVRASLARLGARWTRTKQTLSHRQDQVAVAAAEEVLEAAKKGL